uniref:Uncharacterized protein n=1 Tax=Daphnia galeata TaxID=27404 RepID=A0A8J2RUB0_9CRUS|nr:unnamed protein product [Daphnia galeata]
MSFSKKKKKFLCNGNWRFLVVCCVTYFLFYTQLTLIQNEVQPTFLTIEITSTKRQKLITYLVDGTGFYLRVDTQQAVNQSLRVRPFLIERKNLTANEQYFIDFLTTGRKTYPGRVENYIRYTVIRLGLSPLVHVDPLIPEFSPVIYDVLSSFEYPISIPPCRKNLNVNQTIVILVNSAPDNFERTKII